MGYPPHVEALARPSAYPRTAGARSVQTLETHISYLFLTGERVYKVKKPVDFSFLNFTTLARRRWYCHEEVRLNRRLSPEVYLGVAEIRGDGGHYAVGGRGRLVDYAVVMRQMPQDRTVRRLLERGMVTRRHVEYLARCIWEFHRKAEHTDAIARLGGVRAVKRSVEENFSQSAGMVGVTISRQDYDLAQAYQTAFLDEAAGVLRQRAAEGRVRDCHGDLHTAQIYLEEDHASQHGAKAAFLDCIEFNKRFRYLDTASDLAFLAMDFDELGEPGLSSALVEEYVRLSGDKGLQDVLPFFKAYRAYVRGKVEGFRLEDSNLRGGQRDEVAARSRRYFALSAAYARPPGPLLLVTCGLMATGKSVLARALASRLNATVLSSDIVRKVFRGIAPTERHAEAWGQGLYAETSLEDTYHDLFREARPLLAEGGRVILDASFRKQAWRRDARRLSAETGASFVLIECRAPDDVIRARLETRLRETSDASDARWELFQQQKAAFEPVAGLPRSEHVVVEASAPAPEVTPKALRMVFRSLLAQRGPALASGGSGHAAVPITAGAA